MALKSLFGIEAELEGASSTSPTPYVVPLILAFVFALSLTAVIIRARKVDTLEDFHKSEQTSFAESQKVI